MEGCFCGCLCDCLPLDSVWLHDSCGKDQVHGSSSCHGLCHIHVCGSSTSCSNALQDLEAYGKKNMDVGILGIAAAVVVGMACVAEEELAVVVA